MTTNSLVRRLTSLRTAGKITVIGVVALLSTALVSGAVLDMPLSTWAPAVAKIAQVVPSFAQEGGAPQVPTLPNGQATPGAPAQQGPAEPTVSLLVKTVPGLSDQAAEAVVSRAGGARKRAIERLQLQSVRVPQRAAEAVMKRLQEDPFVERVELDHRRKVAAQAVPPTDPGHATQWALETTGWNESWQLVNPLGSARIAVLDTGVSPAGGDIPLGAGWSAFGTDPKSDPHGHGTWVASIAAAVADNGKGIAGVAFANTTVLPVQVLGQNGEGQDSDVIQGVLWAVENGADVILMAFSNPGFSQSLQDAIDLAWEHGIVVVAATGNEASSTPTFPAGDSKVVGVSATDAADALWAQSNYGKAAFLAAPGVTISAVGLDGSVVSTTGTSASAAMVAGAAALLKVHDPQASNGVIVGRLARNADVAGTQEQTGNGRLNIARALEDTSYDEVVPLGAPPEGDGGPFVGPYRVAAISAQLQGQSNPPCTGAAPCPWQTSSLSGWAELQQVPLRLLISGNSGDTASLTIGYDRDSTKGPGLEDLFGFRSGTDGIVIDSVMHSQPTGNVREYTLNIRLTQNVAGGSVFFETRLMAGAHNYTGNSLQIKSVNFGGGTLGFVKPDAMPGNPDLKLTKTPSVLTAAPGQEITYTLAYQNLASGTGNNATGVQITDRLPANTVFVAGSCSPACVYSSTSHELTWTLGTVAVQTSGSITYKLQVATGTAGGTNLDNTAEIYLAQDDVAPANNVATARVTVQLNKLVFTTDPRTIDTGQISDVITVQTQTFAGAPLTIGTSRTVTLTSSSPTGVFKNEAGTTTITTVTIPAGQSTASFKYTDSTAGTPTIVASSSGLASAEQTVTVNPSNNASISGTVYNDVNGNGLFDNGVDTGIPNVTVTRSGTGTTTVVTDVNGAYSFTGLATGSYDVDYSVPAGFANTGVAKPITGISVTGGATPVNATNQNFFARRTTETVLALTDGSNPSTFGASVTFTATVTSLAGDPANLGTVTFKDGMAVLCSNVALSGNTASCSVSTLSAGGHSITAEYSGVMTAPGYFGSTSGVLAHSVSAAATDVVITWNNSTYNGSPNAASAEVRFGGAPLEGATATLVYYSGVSVATGTVIPSAPVNAGTYTVRATFAGSGNYASSFADATITIAQAPVTATAGSGSSTFDGASKTPSACQVTGVYTGDLACTNNPASVGPAAGTYQIAPVVSGSGQANFSITPVNGTYTITKVAAAAITVTAEGGEFVYNGTPRAGSGSATVGETELTPVTLTYTKNGAPFAGVPTDVGNYTVTAHFAGDTNYEAKSSEPVALTITPAPVTATAGSGSATFDGVTKSPAACVVSGDYTGDLACTNNPASVGPNAGSYTIQPVVSGSGQANFAIDLVNGTYTITKVAAADITVAAVGGSFVYNGTPRPGSGSANVGTTELTPVTLTYTKDGAPFAGVPTDVGSYAVTAHFAGNTNYEAKSSAPVALTITPAPVTAAAGSGSSTFDGAEKTPSACQVTGAYTAGLSCANNPASVGPDAGSYTIQPVVSGSGQANFAIDLVNGTYTITKVAAADITVTAVGGSFVYNGTPRPGSGSATFGETPLTPVRLEYEGTGTTTYGSTVDAPTNVGTYTVTAHFDGNVNYEAKSSAPVALTITPAPVTATAGSGSATFDGEAQTPAACVVTGDYKGNLTCENDPASVGPDAGTYLIAPVVSGSSQANFAIALENGSYTINRVAAADITVTAVGGTFVYDGTSHAGSGSASAGAVSLTPVTLSYTKDGAPFAGVPTDVGSYTVTAHFDGNVNYEAKSSAPAALTITPAPVTATAGSGSSTFDGATKSPAACVVTGDYKGDLTCENDPASVGPDAGTYPIAPVVSGTGQANFSIDLVNGSYTIDPAPTTTVVTCQPGPFTYTGQAQTPCTAVVTGPGGLNESLTVSYQNNTNAGTATASASYAGTDNYAASSDSKTFEIGKATVVGSFTADHKVYDGNTSATVLSRSLTGVLGTDAVTFSGGTATFDTRNVGNGKTVTLTGATLTGAASDNYTLGEVTSWTTTANITPRPLAVSATGVDKVYDGTTDATVNLSTNKVSGDEVNVTSGGAAFADPNVGTNKPVTVTGISISGGADAGNYTLGNTTAATTANITAAPTATTVTVTPATQQYSDFVTLGASVTGGGAPGGTVQFKINGSNVGAAQPLSGGSASLSYKLTQTPSATPFSVTAVFTPASANWMGSTSPAESLTVTKEDMDVQQTGQMFFNTSAVGGTTTAIVSALVQEMDSDLGTVAWDTIPLSVKFTAYTGAQALDTDPSCTAPVPNGTATGSAVASCGISGLKDGQYQVAMQLVVNDYYKEVTGTGALTVTDPGTGFTTGGGWFNDPNTGKRSNFGYTVKYLKNGSIQGNSLFIYRKEAEIGCAATRTYTVTVKNGNKTSTTTVTECAPTDRRSYNFIVKSNSMGAMTQVCSDAAGNEPCWATFTGGFNLKAVDRLTGHEYSFGAGAIGNQGSFQVDVTDNGEPGSQPWTSRGPDQYGIRVQTSQGLIHQVGTSRTRFNPVDGVLVPIDGGNIQVRLKK